MAGGSATRAAMLWGLMHTTSVQPSGERSSTRSTMPYSCPGGSRADRGMRIAPLAESRTPGSCPLVGDLFRRQELALVHFCRHKLILANSV
jgi:hypothetical protein